MTRDGQKMLTDVKRDVWDTSLSIFTTLGVLHRVPGDDKIMV